MKNAALLCVLFLFTFFSSDFYAQTLDNLLKESDKYFYEFNNQASLDAVLKADKKFQNNWEVQWRISRGYVKIADQMPSSSGDQKDAQYAVYEKAASYADNAIKLAGDKSVNYLRRAIANGKIALFKGVFSVAGVVKQVRDDCEKAISLGNGGNEIQGLSHYILARTNAKISEKWKPARAVLGLGWADNEVALQEYKKAIELFPNFIMFYVDYAISLEREDMYKEAREALNKAFQSPKRDDGDAARLEEGKKLYEEIKNKN
jgi:tetratricopeptide (TPR) repeat protein